MNKMTRGMSKKICGTTKTICKVYKWEYLQLVPSLLWSEPKWVCVMSCSQRTDYGNVSLVHVSHNLR